MSWRTEFLCRVKLRDWAPYTGTRNNRKYCGVRCAAGLSASGILGKRAEQEKNKEEKNWYAEMRNKSVQTVKNEKEAGNVRSPCTLKAEMPAVAE